VQGSVSHAVVSVPVTVDGAASMPFIVDTGAPLTLIDPTKFMAAGIQPGAQQLMSLTVGMAVSAMNVQVIAASPCGVMVCSDSQPAGLLGGNVLTQYKLTIDYRGGAVGFNSPTIPNGVGAAVMAPFDLAGGGAISIPGMGGQVTVPATRIALNVEIEGVSHPFVLDTGSSSMVLSSSFFDSLVADGRAQGSVNVSTVNGTENEPSTTLNQVAVGGAVQSNVAAVRSPFDLGVLSAEVGHTVDGLLGGAYLDGYFLTIDYPARQIVLRPYPTQ